MASHANAAAVRRDVSRIVRAPIRTPVSQTAEEFRYLKNPKGYNGPWINSTTPYLVEPMDCLESRYFKEVIFCGPAQSGKTEIILNWLGQVIKRNAADMMIIQTSKTTARDFARRRIDRMLRHSKAYGAELTGNRKDDNTFDKYFKSGNILTIAWPSINELSGRPIPYLALTDYDRMPDDVDHEGSPFDLAKTRTKTFLSKAMTLAESSPGYELLDDRWKPDTPHEAPPTRGILALYNRGDKRRYYVPCWNCNNFYLFECSNLKWEKSNVISESAESAHLLCPKCNHKHYPKIKTEMLASAQWVKDLQTIDSNGIKHGNPPKTKNASFWLQGAAAKFQAWDEIVTSYLEKKIEFEKTGDEQPLKTTINTDQGLPYTSQAAKTKRSTKELMQRVEQIGQKVVPIEARFLLGGVDVQLGKFVAEVHAIGPHMERWVIDRFDIVLSNRKDSEGNRLPIDPAKFQEDWEQIRNVLLSKRYPLAANPEKAMQVLSTLCDSAGAEGVTENAYAFYRRMMKGGFRGRFLLGKGEPKKRMGRIDLAYPDTKTKSGGKKGKKSHKLDIPILFVNTNVVKDSVVLDLDRPIPGPCYVHFPSWLKESYFDELTAETRTDKGWKNPAHRKNESFDLHVMIKALLFFLNVDKIDWEGDLPAWAMPADQNPFIVSAVEEKNKVESIKKARKRRTISKGVSL